MTFIGATDIPTRGVDDFRKTLQDREEKLANAKKQRDTILNDIRKACAAVDAGDQKARFELVGLNKQNGGRQVDFVAWGGCRGFEETPGDGGESSSDGRGEAGERRCAGCSCR